MRLRSLAGAPLCALLAAAAALVPLLALPAAAGAATVDPLRPWALQNEAGSLDVPLDEAIDHAAKHDLITAHSIAYAGDLPAMRAANPNVRVVNYLNAVFVQETEATAFPYSWYAKDATGKKVRNPLTGNYLMQPTVAGWIQSRIDVCRARMAESGYDGCQLDMLGPAPIAAGYVSAAPINPATGQPWTKPDWVRATTALAAKVKAAVAPALVIGNGLSNGAHYWDPAVGTRGILDAVDGASAEAWLRGSKSGISEFKTEADWKRDVDMVVDAEARGKSLLTLTKVWVTGTAAEKEAWRRYALASYLLGSGGRSYFTFSAAATQPPTAWSSIYATDLGAPLAKYAKAGGVYQRAFERGRVIVNPGGLPITVTLPTTLYTLTDLPVTRVTVPAHGGEILTATP